MLILCDIQIKADGTHRNAILSDGDIILESRQGELSYFPEDIPLYDDLREIMGIYKTSMLWLESLYYLANLTDQKLMELSLLLEHYQDLESRPDKENFGILKKIWREAW